MLLLLFVDKLFFSSSLKFVNGLSFILDPQFFEVFSQVFQEFIDTWSNLPPTLSQWPLCSSKLCKFCSIFRVFPESPLKNFSLFAFNLNIELFNQNIINNQDNNNNHNDINKTDIYKLILSDLPEILEFLKTNLEKPSPGLFFYARICFELVFKGSKKIEFLNNVEIKESTEQIFMEYCQFICTNYQNLPFSTILDFISFACKFNIEAIPSFLEVIKNLWIIFPRESSIASYSIISIYHSQIMEAGTENVNVLEHFMEFINNSELFPSSFPFLIPALCILINHISDKSKTIPLLTCIQTQLSGFVQAILQTVQSQSLDNNSSNDISEHFQIISFQITLIQNLFDSLNLMFQKWAKCFKTNIKSTLVSTSTPLLISDVLKEFCGSLFLNLYQILSPLLQIEDEAIINHFSLLFSNAFEAKWIIDPNFIGEWISQIPPHLITSKIMQLLPIFPNAFKFPNFQEYMNELSECHDQFNLSRFSSFFPCLISLVKEKKINLIPEYITFEYILKCLNNFPDEPEYYSILSKLFYFLSIINNAPQEFYIEIMKILIINIFQKYSLQNAKLATQLLQFLSKKLHSLEDFQALINDVIPFPSQSANIFFEAVISGERPFSLEFQDLFLSLFATYHEN